MRFLSATCLSIALASKRGTLRLEVCTGRFGEYVAISDDHGIIEVADDMSSAERRVAELAAP